MILTALMIRLYRWTIRLYPRAFRTDFADEMLAVFELTLRNAACQGVWPALMVGFREIADLPINLLLEYMHQKENAMKQPYRTSVQDIRIARLIARISSLCLTLLFIIIILVTSQPTIFTVTILAMTVSLFIAWRWEKLGGLLTISFVIACAVLVAVDGMRAFPDLSLPVMILWGVGCMVGVIVFWVLPYLLLGWLFVSISRHTVQLPVQSSAH